MHAGKFAAACLGCLLLGIFTEGLSYLRRWVRSLLRARRAPEQILVMCFLYSVQLAFGYFCMLIAMTYQVELFVCVVVGLGAGHGIFNFKVSLPTDASSGTSASGSKGFRASDEPEDLVDPCCQYLAMEEDSEHNTSSKNNNRGGQNDSAKNLVTVTASPLR